METTNIRAEINYVGFDNDKWNLTVSFDNEITIKCNGKERIYKLDKITNIDHDKEYVFFTHPDKSFTQLKFEVNKFLVIDLFDEFGEHLQTIGVYDFYL